MLHPASAPSSNVHQPTGLVVSARAERFAVEAADLAVLSWRRCGEMVIAIHLDFRRQLDASLLARACDLLLDAEPLLGCRLVLEASPPCWERVSPAARQVLRVTASEVEYARLACAPLGPTEGAQVAMCLWQHDDGSRLVIKMTHEAGDGVGLQLLAARLGAIYSRLSLDATYRPEPTAPGRRDFAQLLSGLAWQDYPRLVWDFVSFLAPRLFPRRAHVLPLPSTSAGPWSPVVRQLPPNRLPALASYGRARGATVNDMFLAAAYRALAAQGAWNGTSALRIAITVDLRRWCLPAPHARVIGNLSSFECPFLIRDLGTTFDATLANVTALTRRRKQRFPGLASALLGHAVTTWRGPARLIRQSRGTGRRMRARRSLMLSNEGALAPSTLRFADEAPIGAHILPPHFELPGVHLCISGYDGRLTIAAVTRQNGQAVIERFIDALIDELPSSYPGSS